jgi:hypothetical protein
MTAPTTAAATLPLAVRALEPAVTDPEAAAADMWGLLKTHQPALAGALAILLRGLPADWPRRHLGVTRPDATLTIPTPTAAPYDFPPETSPYRATGDPENCPACGETGNLCRWHTGYATAHGYWFNRLLAAVKTNPGITAGTVLDQHIQEQEDLYGFLDLIAADVDTQTAADAPAEPETVCICGSTRFMDQIAEAALRLTAGTDGRPPAIVHAPIVDLKTPHELWATPADTEAIKERLYHLHQAMIRRADWVLVVGDYIGDSTRGEIAYARSLGKPVRFTDPAIEAEMTP